MAELTADDILRELKKGEYRPVYYLMGEESYYIDLIADYIATHALDEVGREFNQQIIYGGETEIGQVVNAAKCFPMMADRRVVIVREAQQMRNIDGLSFYLKQPLKSTVLVLCHKHGVIDRRKKLASEIEKVGGVVFNSRKLRDYQLPQFINSYLSQHNTNVEAKASAMLADFVGTDLSRLTGEMDKLIIALPEGQRTITPELVEQNIGISKDYNNFELRSAIIERDIVRAQRIVKFFRDNPKNNPVQVTLTVLFNYFSNLMLAHYSPERTEQGIAKQLELKNAWQAREYVAGLRAFSARKTMEIIHLLRQADARSKGMGGGAMDDVLRELVVRMLH